MTEARVLAYVLLLGAVALVTQWLLWLERPGDLGDTFVGPPRSDYVAQHKAHHWRPKHVGMRRDRW